MKKYTIYIVAFLGMFSNIVSAQKSQDEIFNKEVKRIKDKISDITNSEKIALKKSVDSINNLLSKKEISFEKAEELKDEVAQKRAKNIEEKVNEQNEKLSELVKSRAEGNVKSSTNSFTVNLSTDKGLKVYVNDSLRNKNDYIETRTHFNVLFAFGYNNLITNGSLANYDDSFSCRFYEWGGSFKTKLLKNSNLLNLRYGVSFMHNNISPKDNHYFVQNGNQTDVEQAPMNLRKSKFNNTYIAVPVHLEFNFGGSDQYKVGVGGFVGYNIHTSQNLKYTDNGRRIKDMTQKDWNVSDFQYGISGYLGIGGLSVYAKYDLNPLFRNNAVEQHNFSVGLRLDM